MPSRNTLESKTSFTQRAFGKFGIACCERDETLSPAFPMFPRSELPSPPREDTRAITISEYREASITIVPGVRSTRDRSAVRHKYLLNVCGLGEGLRVSTIYREAQGTGFGY